MKVKVLMFCLTTCLAVAATADAQQGGGGGRGRGGGGMMGGRTTSIFRVVENEAVQKELSLSSDDAAKVKKVVEDYRAAVGQFPGGRDMSEDERRAAFEKFAASAKSNAETYLPKLKEVLTADQFTRLQQIYWQAMGVAALSEPEVVKAVSISKEQQDKLKAVNTEMDAKRDELMASMRGGGGDRQAIGEKFQALSKDREMKSNEVLTKDQQDKFASLKGKEFDLSELRGGPGGGGPGGGGGGGARGKRPQPKAE